VTAADLRSSNGDGAGLDRHDAYRRGLCVDCRVEPHSDYCSPLRIRAAKKLRPGAFIWPNGADRVQVLAVLPSVDGNSVTVFTDSDGTVAYFSCAADRSFHTRAGRGSWTFMARALDRIYCWHRERDMRCCAARGPYCCESLAWAYEQLRYDRGDTFYGRKP
jgi:hypothetical protein